MRPVSLTPSGQPSRCASSTTISLREVSTWLGSQLGLGLGLGLGGRVTVRLRGRGRGCVWAQGLRLGLDREAARRAGKDVHFGPIGRAWLVLGLGLGLG